MPAAAVLLADAIARQAKILIVADYDCDGATACAVGIRALRAFGARVDYLVPNRFTYGYGLSPDIVDLAAKSSPDLIVTVDNGIASVDGVARARELGIATLITDHHLPGDELPAAACIVNPNQPGCDFPSKALAGVGVMFYVMLALRAELRQRDWFSAASGRSEPKLATLLDLVALGTVADVVKLDHNNRVLVSQGLQRIRQGRLTPGIAAIFRAAGRNPAQASSSDLGFIIGPRLNAAGRLADMSLGIECLITDDPGRAMNIAQQLDALNRERREIEAGMQEQALLLIEKVGAEATDCGPSLGSSRRFAVRRRLAPGRRRHRRRAHQGKAAPPGFRLRPRRGGRRRNQGLWPLGPRSAPARRARPGRQARTRPAAALRRPRHGRWRDHQGVRFAAFSRTLRAGRRGVAGPRRPHAHPGNRRRPRIRLLLDRHCPPARSRSLGPGFPGTAVRGRVRRRKPAHPQGQASQAAPAQRRTKAGRHPVQLSPTPPGNTIRAAYRLAINDYNGVQTPQLMIEHIENRSA
jgi:single-stranded-DNA-specific exonuclease